MNIFATLLAYALGLVPKVVLGIETVIGDAKAGASKKQMAQDALTAAVGAAATVIAPGSTEAEEAQLAATAVSGIIQTLDPITDAVNAAKATGAYQAATATAAKTQQAAADTKSAAAAAAKTAAMTTALASGSPQPDTATSTEDSATQSETLTS